MLDIANDRVRGMPRRTILDRLRLWTLRMLNNRNQSCVIAFAGRRTDEENAEKLRFPFEKVSAVREALTALFLRERAVGLVASASCGSDLTALAAARAIGIRSRIVLPFWSDHFRQTSVVDRPHAEYWGALFDRVIDYAKSCDDLVVLDLQESAQSIYSHVNRAILRETDLLVSQDAERRRLAVIAWDGDPRGEEDYTKEFADLAIAAGFQLGRSLNLRPSQRSAY